MWHIYQHIAITMTLTFWLFLLHTWCSVYHNSKHISHQNRNYIYYRYNYKRLLSSIFLVFRRVFPQTFWNISSLPPHSFWLFHVMSFTLSSYCGFNLLHIYEHNSLQQNTNLHSGFLTEIYIHQYNYTMQFKMYKQA